MRRLVPLLGALVLLGACSSADRDDPEAAPAPADTAAPAPSGASTPATPPPAAVAGCEGAQVVDVSTGAQLQRALDDATAGQVIRLADGRYEGNFVATAEATVDAPIHLCGSRGAVLDGGEIDGNYTLHLSGADHWRVTGLTVTGGQKGVMVDAGVGNRIEGLLVTSMGDEAIHLRTHSTDNVVVGNTIRDTGLRKPQFGEGIYVGTAESNWCQISDCEPDRSDRNVVDGNDIAGTTAEAVDIKEGTTGGMLRGNSFDGSDMVEADSWVDVKGNDWTVADNTGTAAPVDGFQVHEVVDGWGRGNVFTGNTGSVDGDGYMINVAGPRTIRENNRVSCDNDAGGADQGISNIDCGRA
ncbi:NosD domain-containing protein [Modestobacter sp. VKM Ac-2984]|uniref:NosD domain-containing protein n=1 Tax=Modestobacter sp. VKM Ac-2984 TaxID=3004138 RepID=UPI0022AACAF4|nr:NosD domain-containing protein [Modestobacter sp. VKM Ac-2984]MCZ2816898.1 right-handed parallel beta-helix repeat-containing protein [Modestobacter sp. VKM Ac-2984]